MSIQAVAWALEQDFSYTTAKGRQTSAHGAKLVLISLCNHADHKSGHCWPSAETIARESSCSVRSVYRLIAALERNGYVDIKRGKGGNGKQRSNNYWIRFDRPVTSWQFFDEERDEDNAEDASPGDTVSPDHNTDGESENPSVSPGTTAIDVTRHIMPEPSVIEPSAPAGFSRAEQKAEQEKLQAAEEARKPKQYFVVKGSNPWNYWVKHGHRPTLHTWSQKDQALGWWFPTLYPPKATGPPHPTMTEADEEEFSQKWG